MDDERIVISSSAAISPEAVAGKGFTTSMRGYQPAEVRQFLNRVADELAAGVARENELRRALHDLQTRAAHPELDESVLTASLGEHAGRLIASARETAAAITAEAERTAAATLRDAEFRIARIRQEADTLMARRVDEADGVSASLRQSAEADARAVRDQAQADAEAAIQAARSHGKEMVAEARAVRERMLGDLSRRRRVAEVQLEQLRVARGRLVEAYEVVRRTLAEVTAELAAAEPEARLAAEAVGRRMAEADPPPPLRLPDPPYRPAPPPAPTASPIGAPSAPSGGPVSDRGRGEPADRASVPPTRPETPASSSGPFQPAHLAPPSMPAPAVSDPPSHTDRTAHERPPVPPGWIERAGGTGPLPPIPPSVAAPDDDEPTDPGTWAGAGFGPPKDAARPSRRSGENPSSPDPVSRSRSDSSTAFWTEPGSAPPADAGSSSGPAGAAPTTNPDLPSSTSSGSGSGQARVAPAPLRPPLRPQTVADSLPSRNRAVLTEAPPAAGAGGPAANGVPAPAPAAAAAIAASAPALASDPADAGPAGDPPAPAEPTPTPTPTSDPSPGATRSAPASSGFRSMPPDLPPLVPPAPPEQAPELATAEVPSVAAHGEGSAPVEELFARLRDQVPAPAPEKPRAAPAVAPSDEVLDEGALARRDQQLDPLDADLTRSLKRILQDEQNEVLERLRHGGGAVVSSLLAVLDHQTSAFTTAAAPVLSAAYRAGGGDGDDTTGFALGGRLANDLATPFRERLERVVAGAGGDLEELAEAVRAAYRHAKLQEIEQLVRHHTAAAHALGAYVATASGSLLRWVADDEGPCPDCHDNTLAGPTPKGEPFPTGQDHPPAHLGCRCLLVLVAP